MASKIVLSPHENLSRENFVFDLISDELLWLALEISYVGRLFLKMINVLIETSSGVNIYRLFESADL
jgi:hypothetical protein